MRLPPRLLHGRRPPAPRPRALPGRAGHQGLLRGDAYHHRRPAGRRGRGRGHRAVWRDQAPLCHPHVRRDAGALRHHVQALFRQRHDQRPPGRPAFRRGRHRPQQPHRPAGLERGVGLPRRPGLPRVSPQGSPQRPAVLARHRPPHRPRRQGCLPSRLGPVQGSPARRSLRPSGGAGVARLRRRHRRRLRPDRFQLRYRAVRPLVVRRRGLDPGSAAPAGGQPAGGADHRDRLRHRPSAAGSAAPAGE